ncbi:hypothetical protein SUDANB95_04483 [Actinosynnema sp. ALI-1.44]
MPIFQLGGPADIVFTANQAGAAAFVYTLDDGREQTVPVGADGTARFTHTPQSQGQLVVVVSSRTPDGTVSGQVSRIFSVPP